MSEEFLDVIIIGGGPAGLTAAIYSSRLGMKTRVFERSFLGGRASEAYEVWNYPGFPKGISGVELTERMVEQTKNQGAEILFPQEIIGIKIEDRYRETTSKTGHYVGTAIIIATGTQKKKIAVPGETLFLGRGVSYCAVCDAPLFKDRKVSVVGFGNEAFEDALYLSKLSKQVILVTNGAKIEANRSIVEECKERNNINIIDSKIKAIVGNNIVKSIEVSDSNNGFQKSINVDGVFISLGTVPLTKIIGKAGVNLDERGCIKVDRRQQTNIEGVFAAGDCTCGGMQIVTASGEGAMAAIQAYRYSKKTKN